MHFPQKTIVAFVLSLVSAVAAAKSPPLRVARTEGVVEIENGLVKARISTGKDGVKQEYLAARGSEWVAVAESLRPQRPLPEGANVLYDSARDPAHCLIVTEILDAADVGQEYLGGAVFYQAYSDTADRLFYRNSCIHQRQ